MHRYTARALKGDVMRAVSGMAICLFIIFAVGVTGVALAIFLGLAAVFAAFATQLLLRAMTVVTLDAAGIATVGPRRRSLPWRDLDGVKLKFFRTRRRGGDGTMQLTLRSPAGGLTVDSQIEGFGLIARRAHEAARANGLTLTEITAANFAALGLDDQGWGAPAGWTAAEERGLR